MHYHFIELKNGDSGKVCTAEKMPDKIAPGSEITYTINNQSIKLIQFNSAPTQAPVYQKPAYQKPAYQKPTTPGTGYSSYKNTPKKPEDYLGFVFGYAKDITCKLIEVGNKNAISKPVELTNKMAEEFYSKIKELLMDEPPNE